MKTNKILAFILSVLILVPVLASCSSTNVDISKNDDNEYSEPSDTSKDTALVIETYPSSPVIDDETKEDEETEEKETEEKKEKETEKKEEKEPEIEEEDGLTYIDGILIANKTYSLPKTYAPGVDTEANNALKSMFAGASKEGVSLWVTSGYRSYETQSTLYNNYVARDGKEEADRYSARAGHSEHQTGLAFDLNSLEQSFGQTKEGKWLADNCHKYGFIIRYPEGKEEITGYMYEPWHVRYIGVDKATEVYESGLCLEEFLNITSAYED